MDLDHVISGGRVLLNRDLVPADIGIQTGQIVALGRPGAFRGAAVRKTLDARGQLVLPGGIDSHFHCRAPSHPEREEFVSATAAAAAGGVTSLIEMPISVPPTTNGRVLRARAELALTRAYVNVGFYSSAATLRREDLEGAIEAGALAFKAFLQHVPPGREDEFTGLCLSTNGELLEAFELLKDYHLPCAFHAEDEAMLRELERRLREAGRRDGRAHAESRPDFVEAVSVGTLMRLSERFGVHVHVPHVSSQMTVEVIRDAKRRGANVTAETCPHYLEFDASALARLGPYAKCNPPLKGPHDTRAIWEAVRDGTIDTVASDHSPFTVEEKERARDDIWSAPPGFPGVEVLVSYVIGAALEGRLAIGRAAELLYESPARIFGLWPRKGVIGLGADADLVLYNPSGENIFDHDQLRTKARGTALIWDGVRYVGSVRVVLVRGDVVYDRGELIGRPGCGSHLVPV